MKKTFLARLTPITAATAMAITMIGSAQAADPVLVSTKASLSNLTFQLIDLDPTDGITPWIQFSTQGTLDTGYYGGGSGSTTFSSPINNPLPAQTQTATSPDGNAIAVAGPTSLQASSSITLGQLAPITTYASIGSGANVSVSGNVAPDTGIPYPSMTLSANTLLIIRGSASVQVNRDLSSLQTALNASTADWMNITGYNMSASTSIGLSTSTYDPNTGTDSSTYSSFSLFTPNDGSLYTTLYKNNDPTGLPLTESYTSAVTPFSVQLANTGASNIVADFSASAVASGYLEIAPVYVSQQPPVPEPSTYFLTGLGLVAAGAVARKRGTVAR